MMALYGDLCRARTCRTPYMLPYGDRRYKTDWGAADAGAHTAMRSNRSLRAS